MKPLNPPLHLRALATELRREAAGCRSILELGCGVDSPSKFLAHQAEIDGLDIFEPALEAARKMGFLTRYHLGSAMEVDRLFAAGSFDAVIALDLIEHLPKEEGFVLIEKMSRVARKKVIIFTPNGFVRQDPDENPWQEHRSGWTAEDFRKLGFEVTGINGPKAMRGERARLRFKPRWFFGALSELLHHLWTRNHPEAAFSLFCLKKVGDPAEAGKPGAARR